MNVAVIRPVEVADTVGECLLAVEKANYGAAFGVVGLTTGLFGADPSRDVIRNTSTKRERMLIRDIVSGCAGILGEGVVNLVL